jgi:micrococcal nuclease
MTRYPVPSPHRRRSHPSKPTPRRRRFGIGLWLLLVAGGGFAGTLAALQIGPDQPAAAAIEAVIRKVPAARDFALDRGRTETTLPAAAPDRLTARFGFCHSGGGKNCVVDGDTFWFAGEKYRIADIDTPETHPARCAEEAALGEAATQHLRQWLNRGAFTLESGGRDSDRYGRKLRVVTRGGTSVGDDLIDQGLARPWEGARRPWC